MLPVWFAMCVCSFLQIVFVESGRFVYNETRNCALKFIRLQQNENSVVGLFYAQITERKLCDYQPQPPDLPGVDGPAFCRINPGSGYIGMAQNICQTGQVTLQGIVGAGKEVAQIVGEYLGWLHPGALAQGLHIPPDVGSIQRPPVF